MNHTRPDLSSKNRTKTDKTEMRTSLGGCPKGRTKSRLQPKVVDNKWLYKEVQIGVRHAARDQKAEGKSDETDYGRKSEYGMTSAC